jgi:8-oxo-dGTP pyrophosphatase MutT (NUDIX family)
MTKEVAPARPSSTILLLRERVEGFDVFMMVRHHQIEFASGGLVFPGGSVDAADRAIAARPELYASGAAASDPALEFRIAAVRETFEESGILLARLHGSDQLIDAARAAEIEAAHRAALCEGKLSFADVIGANGLVLALDLLVPYAHWVTPVVMPKRFETWFFLAKAPPDQVGMHDGKEATDSIWLSPREALQGSSSGRFNLPFPTARNLVRLGKQPTVAAAFDDALNKPIVTVMPVLSKHGDKRMLRIPAEAGYDGELFEVPAG